RLSCSGAGPKVTGLDAVPSGSLTPRLCHSALPASRLAHTSTPELDERPMYGPKVPPGTTTSSREGSARDSAAFWLARFAAPPRARRVADSGVSEWVSRPAQPPNATDSANQ